jgi:hypothetical protein
MPTCERLAAHLDAAAGDLVPGAGVHLAHAVAELARQHHDLRDDHLGDAAGVAEGRVEDRPPEVVRRRERHLVGADAEAPHGHELRARGEHARRDLRLAADAEHLHAAQALDEGVFAEGVGDRVDPAARVEQQLVRAGVNVLEQQHLEAGRAAGRRR